MYCISCGTEIPDNSAFCLACGTKTPEVAEVNVNVEVVHDEQSIATGVRKGLRQKEIAESSFNFLVTESMILSAILFICLWVGPLSFGWSLLIAFLSAVAFIIIWHIKFLNIVLTVICSLGWGFVVCAIASFFIHNGFICIAIALIAAVLLFFLHLGHVENIKDDIS